jgi:hypothetical protein
METPNGSELVSEPERGLHLLGGAPQPTRIQPRSPKRAGGGVTPPWPTRDVAAPNPVRLHSVGGCAPASVYSDAIRSVGCAVPSPFRSDSTPTAI